MQQANILFTPLAASLNTQGIKGRITCHSIYSKAINLCVGENKLLTIQRTGQGISPFGIVLTEDEFLYLADELSPGQVGEINHQGIIFGALNIELPKRYLDLQVQTNGEVRRECFFRSVAQSGGETGLYGDLAQALQTPLNSELIEIQRRIIYWLEGETVSWEDLIGKGPGLTPSMDDTLIGILLMIYSDCRLAQRLQQSDFFTAEEFRHLDKLTTIVSVNYLQCAAQGIFSTPLLHLSRAICGYSVSDEIKTKRRVEQILNLGHHSGADTLLGVGLVCLALNEYINKPYIK